MCPLFSFLHTSVRNDFNSDFASQGRGEKRRVRESGVSLLSFGNLVSPYFTTSNLSPIKSIKRVLKSEFGHPRFQTSDGIQCINFLYLVLWSSTFVVVFCACMLLPHLCSTAWVLASVCVAQYAPCLGSVLSSCRGGDLVLCLANHLHSVSGERLSLVLKRSQGSLQYAPGLGLLVRTTDSLWLMLERICSGCRKQTPW